MPEAVTAQLLAAEPPRDNNDRTPEPCPFEYAKDGHADSGFAISVLVHPIATDEPPRMLPSLDRFLVALD